MTRTPQALTVIRGGNASWDLDGIVEQLRISREVTHNIRHQGRAQEVPSRKIIDEIVEKIGEALFPSHLGPPSAGDQNADVFVRNTLDTALLRLSDQIRRSLVFGRDYSAANAEARAAAIIRGFATALPSIRTLLVEDLRAAKREDASSGSNSEILLCNRGLAAIYHHRIAHALHLRGARLVARIIADIAHVVTGAEIHPGASIAQGLCLPHTAGLIIGEATVIGSNVRLHQGVTLAAEHDLPPVASGQRTLIVEDNVILHAGCRVSGRITIGRDSVIGPGTQIRTNVAPNSVVSSAG